MGYTNKDVQGISMTQSMTKPAVLLIDVINAFDFDGCEAIVEAAKQAAPAIEALTQKARAQGIPVIYANDNFGQWRSDFKSTVVACTERTRPGHEIAAR